MKVYKWLLCVVLVVVIGIGFVLFGNFQSDDSSVQPVQTHAPVPQSTETAVTEFTFSEEAFNTRLLTVINAYRERSGLAAWSIDPQLSSAAETRASECSLLESKSHTRPDDSDWSTVLNISENYNYSEITGISGQTPDDLLRSWVASEAINNGLLSAEYTACGVGCEAIGSRIYCVMILYKP